jgi:hypothetical protein
VNQAYAVCRVAQYAEELEARASKVVERQAAALAPRAGAPNAGAAIERQQQQPQQQQGAEPASPTDQKPKGTWQAQLTDALAAQYAPSALKGY